jgi:hypothetical protein
VAQYIDQGGVANRAASACGATCTDLWLSEHRPMPNQVASSELHAELQAVRSKAGILPAAEGIAGLASKVSLVGTAAYAGWEIGTAIRSLWYDSPLPGVGPEVKTAKAYKEGQHIGNVNFGGGDTREWVAPGDVWVASDDAGAPLSSRFITGYCCNESFAVDFAGWVRQPFTGTQLGSPTEYDFGYLRLIPEIAPVAEDGSLEHGPYLDGGITVPWPADGSTVPFEAVSDASLNELVDHPGDYPVLEQWIASHTTDTVDDPTGQRVRVPDCNGVTAEQCVGQLQDLGLHGVIVTLSDAAADPAFGPDVVVRTNPRLHRALAIGSDVTVVVNPATAPDAAPGDGTGGSTAFDPHADGPADALFTAPTPPGIDFGPLNVGQTCTAFPFGVPCWLAATLQPWLGAAPVTPHWNFYFPFGGHVEADLHMFDDSMPAIRAITLGLAIVSIVWLFVSFAYGSIGSGNKETD